jgi:septal ring factor EnvC (AmiA/AmiB activator)
MPNAKTTYLERAKNAGEFLGIIAACLALALVLLVIAFAVKVHSKNAVIADTQKQLTQAKADTAKVQAELDKDKAGTVELQAQLDKAKDDLKKKDELATLVAAQEKTQEDKAKGASTQLIGQLEADKAHAADLQAQLDQAAAGSAQLNAQLSQEKIKSMDLQARLQKAEGDIAELQPMLLKTGHMPVTTSVEKTQGGRTFTLHINNLYLQPVSVDVAITGANKTRSQHNIIGSGATQNVEKLAAGDNVVITSEGYDPVKLTVQ